MAVKTKLPLSFLNLVSLLVIAIAVPSGSLAQIPANTADTLSPVTTASAFRIGSIRYDPDTRISADLLQQMRDHLVTLPEIQEGMQRNGIAAIEVQSFDAHRWLMEAMDGEQVDMAFCSSVDYVYQIGDYVPVFQLRLPGDRPGRGRLYHYATIFIGNQSPLFPLERQEIQEMLPSYMHGGREMALVGPNSASGYIYPLLKMAELTSPTRILPPTRFWGSSEEVVKAVINGAAEIGACDEGAVDEVLRSTGLMPYRDRIIKEIAKTARLPRDPVVLHRQWSPETSLFGRQISAAARAWFETLPRELPRLEPSSDPHQFAKELRGSLINFSELRNRSTP